jgi:hypothetical protein
MIRGRLAAWRYRIELYSRLRWTEPLLHEIELAIMGAALLVALMALLMVWGRRG